DGIRDGHVTGVQTCALRICHDQRKDIGRTKSRFALVDPAKKSPLQEASWFPWQKHPSSLYLFVVHLAKTGLHPAFLAPRQQIVKPKHVDINDEKDEARPRD